MFLKADHFKNFLKQFFLESQRNHFVPAVPPLPRRLRTPYLVDTVNQTASTA